MEYQKGHCEWCGEYSKHLTKEHTQGAMVCPACKEVIPEMLAWFATKEMEVQT